MDLLSLHETFSGSSMSNVWSTAGSLTIFHHGDNLRYHANLTSCVINA